MKRLSITTAIGSLIITEDRDALVAIEGGTTDTPDTTPLLREAARQLQAFLAGGLQRFSLPIRIEGTAFQQRIWAAIQAIPYGETRFYGELASMVGSLPRPVGMACGANRLMLVIPCHRVVGRGGLTGYSGPGGIDTKQFLIGLERRHAGCERRSA